MNTTSQTLADPDPVNLCPDPGLTYNDYRSGPGNTSIFSK
jgi:hypothetical protein